MKAKRAKRLVRLIAKEVGKQVAKHMDACQFDLTLKREDGKYDLWRRNPNEAVDDITITRDDALYALNERGPRAETGTLFGRQIGIDKHAKVSGCNNSRGERFALLEGDVVDQILDMVMPKQWQGIGYKHEVYLDRSGDKLGFMFPMHIWKDHPEMNRDPETVSPELEREREIALREAKESDEIDRRELEPLPEGWNYYSRCGGAEVIRPIIIDKDGECWIEYDGDLEHLKEGVEVSSVDGWQYFQHRVGGDGPARILLRNPDNNYYIRLNDPHGKAD